MNVLESPDTLVYVSEKVGALFRDSLHTQYRSAGKTKAQLRASIKKRQIPMREHNLLPNELILSSSFGSFDFEDYC